MRRYLPLLFAVALLTPTRSFAATCVTTTCHSGLLNLAFPHQPVKDGACDACHEQQTPEHPQKGRNNFRLTSAVPKLCDQCHQGFGSKKIVHAPVKGGECLACHKPHGASGRNLIDGDDQTALCSNCHDPGPFKQKVMHGPAAVGACTQCHNPHESTEKSLLKTGTRDLCLGCHSDFAKEMAAAGFVHPPVKEEACTSCHNPHGSPFSHVLKQRMPELCTSCHDNIGKKMSAAKVPHKPLADGKSCGNCHSSHFSKAKWLLASDEKGLCLTCHSGAMAKSSGLKNIAKEIEGKKFLHGPIRSGNCGTCHDPHGSDYYRLLGSSYPATFYAPYTTNTYESCLRCHERNLLSYPETTIYTKFRNGKRNLHFVHVADKRKGRTCRACHNAHASDGSKLISTAGVTFGEWTVPIRFEPTATGGSCAPGCHRSFSYDREKPVDYDSQNPPK